MIPVMYLVNDQLKRRSNLMVSSILRQFNPRVKLTPSVRRKQTKNDPSISSLFKPVTVKVETNDRNVGVELTGSLSKRVIIQILCNFANKNTVKELSTKHGLDDAIFNTAMGNFRKYCVDSNSLPPDLHIVLSDIINGAGNVTDIFPYFLRYAKQMYPHIDCLDELRKISDLRNPPFWYPIARSKKRKIIFHAGPTNSGKTYHALKRFMSAKSGVYCGPLKLLANEVFNKCNSMGTPCDLITGEEHRYAKHMTSPADHTSCSVEMANIQNVYEVAVIDEIQLIRDPGRGWAWTRALLGIAADEIHLCGESAAIPIVQSICLTTGEHVEIKEYKRLTELEVENSALCYIKNVQPGDCIVCFSRNEIFAVSNEIEKLGEKVAVIYGSLPPGTKLAQAARFNDPKDPCKILVATNAIGMGLNLHIRRIIFYTLSQPVINEKGEMEIDTISVSSALQIAGRAGRYGTQWSKGYVTTFKPEDLPVLRKLLQQKPEEIHRAGLHPTADQIELYSYYLPNAPMSNLINIFIALCELDHTLYFICNLDDFKFLADMIQHIPLPLRTRYVFCCAPVNRKVPFTCSMLLKYARQCSRNQPATISWVRQQIEWPPSTPSSLADLVRLEGVFDVLDVYLWLSYRMPDLFPDGSSIRQLQFELDKIIETGIRKLAKLFRKTQSGDSKEESQKSDDKLEGKNQDKETLSHSLVSRGLLTKKMLDQLRTEWAKETSKGKTKHDRVGGRSKFRS
ncbi:ATP-dependent RNA helicase SUV3 homolog, mitochondrial isoform X2 [Ceratina calcarata]|uniref:ATP-dependent RNA helicase SUV3 homolog, mitochondrial n=1 Tax=Ceratina calcarata TaxID=156304 RepID=A0AAJ7JGP7_9HYME|nr:ATP-dependent RNA helicase SUV3 homolog, mitochondrial isoform X2 [Ceratina calcarata]